jgi:uncharacterized protein YggU (UPF0235/DUF167 family)
MRAIGQDCGSGVRRRKQSVAEGLMDERADLRRLARPGAVIAVRVTPRSAREGVAEADGIVALRVTAPPVDGAATDAARRLLARAMGVAPSRLVLVAGAGARIRRFRLD